jgi:hypothetical protein
VLTRNGGDGAAGTVIFTFRELPPPTPVPTMSAYGLLSMAGLMGILGAWRQRRRKR